MVRREELHNSSFCMSRANKGRKMRWVACVALMCRNEKSVKIFSLLNPERRYNVGELGESVTIILKRIIERRMCI
jgi:hypothetical protein